MGWLDARNLCRELCMDLVSIETPEENAAVTELVRERNLHSVWTSGRLCNFQGCNQPHLQPRHINGKMNATKCNTKLVDAVQALRWVLGCVNPRRTPSLRA